MSFKKFIECRDIMNKRSICAADAVVSCSAHEEKPYHASIYLDKLNYLPTVK